MSQPLFSIIIPIYNVEEYLCKCIESILNQSCQDFELILVDDGSPDRCPLICDQYCSTNVKVIHKANGGPGSARQEGIKIATGRYVIFVDGDDWTDVYYLNWASQIIKKHSPDIICFGHYVATGDTIVETKQIYRKGMYNKEQIKQEIYPLLIENDQACTFSSSVWAKVFRKDLYEEYQLSVDCLIKMGEDSAVVKPCIYHANSLYIDDNAVYYYRYNPTSLTKSKKASDWAGPRMRAKHLMNHINMNEQDFQQQLYRATVHSLFNVVVSQFNRKDGYAVLVKEIKKEISEDFYAKAIEQAKFRSLRGKIMVFALKRRLFCLIKLYCQVR